MTKTVISRRLNTWRNYEIFREKGDIMGLDMFLDGIYEEDGKTLREQVIYWRKANQVHNWFVLNAQDGEDNCKPCYVSKEQLVELKDLCEQVIEDNDKAEELLPTKAGFFFGSIDFDEGYFFDLEYTVKKIGEVLEDERFTYFEYCSWW